MEVGAVAAVVVISVFVVDNVVGVVVAVAVGVISPVVVVGEDRIGAARMFANPPRPLASERVEVSRVSY